MKFSFISLLVLFQFGCSSVLCNGVSSYKRKAYNSVSMLEIEFTIVDEKTKETSNPAITATGFAIDSRYIATAGHFCIAAFEIAATAQDLKTTLYFVDKDEEISALENFKIAAIDKKNDLCIIDKPNHGLKPVKLSQNYHPRIRDTVFIIGSPRSTFPIETEGFVSMPSIYSDIPEMNGKIMCSLSIYRGNSGSPMFNSKGEVVRNCCYGR